MRLYKLLLPCCIAAVLCLGCRHAVSDNKAKATQILSDPPGARVEVNSEYIGETPTEYKFAQSSSGKIIGNYVIQAFPTSPGLRPLQKHLDGPYVPGTGHADKVPAKLFFDTRNGWSGAETEKAKISAKAPAKTGSGFMISPDGYVLTCYHVVKDAETIEVKHGQTSTSATLIRKDLRNDVALLKLQTNVCSSYLSVAESATVKLGDPVFTVGFPNPDIQGVQPKFTDGAVSSLTGYQDDSAWFQVSVPVQPGNSGGALISKSTGQVVGMIVAALSYRTVFLTGALPENVNYALKGSHVRLMLQEIPELAPRLNAPPAATTVKQEDLASAAESAVVMVIAK